MKKPTLVILLAIAVFCNTANAQTINCLTVNGSNIYAGTWGSGIYFSADNGSTWKQVWNTNIQLGTFQKIQDMQRDRKSTRLNSSH